MRVDVPGRSEILDAVRVLNRPVTNEEVLQYFVAGRDLTKEQIRHIRHKVTYRLAILWEQGYLEKLDKALWQAIR